MKRLLALLVFLSVVYSTAPSWVDKGVSLNYSKGNDLLSFTVISKSATQVTFEQKTFSNSGSLKSSINPTVNASKNPGPFWFDPALLDGAFIGQAIGEYSVTDKGQQNFAGKSWDAVTLEQILGSVSIKQTFDKKTGLLLKQTVNVSGEPEISLTQQYIPAFAPPPPAPTPTPTPTPNPTPQPNNTVPAQPNQTVTPAPTPTPNPAPTPGPAPSKSKSSVSIPSPQTQPPLKLPCCPSALIFLIIPALLLINRK